MSNAIISYFWNVITSGVDLGVTFFSTCGFMLPYIIATKKGAKVALDSVLFLFLGRMFYFMFFGAFTGFYPNIVSYFYFDTVWIYYINVFFGFLLIVLGLLLLLSSIKKYKILEYLYKWDHLYMFILGIIIGSIPIIPSKLFFSDLILNTNNYILGLISGFVFGLAGFVSFLIVLALILGYVSRKIYGYNKSLYFAIQKISAVVIIYLGLKFIIEVLVIIHG